MSAFIKCKYNFLLEVLTVMTMKSTVAWNVTPCSLEKD
jgi:hypothetical protein